MTTRQDAERLDRDDPLAPLRAQFTLPEGLIYLDGNSLGVLPSATADRVAAVVRQEWGQGLICSWNSAGWIHQPQRVGDKIGRLVGAAPGELVVADSTSVNLFKVLSAAMRLQTADHRVATPARRVILSERENFPTDLYIAEGLVREAGWRLELLRAEEIAPRLAGERGRDVGVVMLTQVNYRTGRLHDMAAVSAAAHAAGALAVWDLAHSAGALPVDLNGAGADFAVGCGYKYLNGGPGAPAFVWVHPRHADRFWQPLSGWMGHAAPFRFTPDYQPAPGVGRYLCGTPPVIAMAALECGVDTLLAAEPLGGLAALRAKSLALGDFFLQLVDERCAAAGQDWGLGLATPREHALRGSQVSLTHATHGYAIVQALIARGVVGDFRAGEPAEGLADILRFGFTPLYVGFVDVWNAVEQLVQVMASGEYQEARFNQRAAVT